MFSFEIDVSKQTIPGIAKYLAMPGILAISLQNHLNEQRN